MKQTKAVSALLFVAYMVLVIFLQKRYPNVVIVAAVLIGGLFVFSLIVRRSIAFKTYFTNRYNFFTSKVRHQKRFELPKDILFDKITEVLMEAGFKVRHTDKSRGVLFATAGMTLFSWGENIYIDLTEQNGLTQVDMCSTTFFGVTSWGRNEKNYEHLFDTFERSLTI